tara:strand:- start:628 stop:999 length:372 start_codon:yes stop_codon:yes gene_type:complete
MLNTSIKGIVKGDITSWYQPHLTREEATIQLDAHSPGTFVFRKSHSVHTIEYGTENIVSLSLHLSIGIRHFLVGFKEKQWNIIGTSIYFIYFSDLIEYYSKHTIYRRYTTKFVKALPFYNLYA